MAVGNLPLFPSTVCQIVSRKGSKSVNIFVTARESARLYEFACRAWLYFETSYLIIKNILQNVCICVKSSWCSVPLSAWRVKWWVSQKGGRLCSHLGGQGVSVCKIHVGIAYTWAVKTSYVDWGPSQVKLYLHQKAGTCFSQSARPQVLKNKS